MSFWMTLSPGCDTPADVVFAVDSSGSIGKENFQKAIDFVKNVARELPVSTSSRVGLETFSDNEKVLRHVVDIQEHRD